MKVPLSWLTELAPIPTDVDAIASTCQELGLLVEDVHQPVSLPNVVVGQVIECRPIEGAKKVQLVVVDGGDGPREVMCGAFNFGPGDKVPLALPGAELPGGFTIAVREVKSLGVTSHGMLCAADELGLGDDHAGIMILDADAPVGALVVDVLGLDEVVIEFEITPNRPDCMSVMGIARELAAAFGVAFTPPPIEPATEGTATADLIKISIEAGDDCTRYAGIVVEGVTVAPSPHWLAKRLVAAGMRPINNVVDVTNYVLLERGQPIHAFDLDTLAGPSIVVRNAADGDTIVTLDDTERALVATDVVICDAERAVALAGVMGGQNSEVAATTTRILVESAHFRPAAILQTSKRLGLRSESSARFERGVDPGGVADAAKRVALLLHELAGGTVRPGVVDVGTIEPSGPTLVLRPARVNALLGTDLSAERITELLEGIGIVRVPGADTADGLGFNVPTWRSFDLEREADLIEEVARLVGYNSIPRTLPAGRDRVGGLSAGQKARRRLRQALLAAGCHEAHTTSFVSQAAYDRLGWGEPPRVVVRNPLRDDEKFLRTSLVPNLLVAAARNTSRNVSSVRLAEIGTVFAPSGSALPTERTLLCVVLAGADPDVRLDAGGKARAYDARDVVGVLAGVAEDLGVTLQIVQDGVDVPAGLHPGRSGEVRMGETRIGWVGELHPRVADAWDLPRATVLAEVDADALLGARADRIDAFTPVAAFPASFYDLAFVVDEATPVGAVRATLAAHGGEFCRSVEVFDIFRGGRLADGSKSVAFEIVFRSGERTLTDDDVQPAVDAMVTAARDAHGAELRA